VDGQSQKKPIWTSLIFSRPFGTDCDLPGS
jgi:hypothetical protein